MEEAILHGIQDVLGNKIFDAILPVITMLGELGAVWVVIGLSLALSRRWRFWGLCMLVALLCVGVFNELAIKGLFARPRPFIADPSIQLIIAPPSGYSFPSGHTGASFAAATVLALSPASRTGKVLAWITASLIAFSRMYLFAHYPTDVLAGALLGVLYAVVVVKVGRTLS